MSDYESLIQELAQLRAEYDRLLSEHERLIAAAAPPVTQTDVLTGLPSRMLLLDHLNQALARARRNEHSVAVFALDLDRFKLINETLGLGAGDEVIRAIAERLRAFIREYDTLARIGGDEFCLLLADLADVQDAVKMAERITDALTIPVCVAGHEIFVAASIGISIYPHDGAEASTLLKNAEAAMFRAKAQGSTTPQLYAPAMNASFAERLTLENSLRKALTREEFVLHYQPQYCVSTGDMIGAEALIRWQHPDLGLVSPLKFIPLAEEMGLIIPLTAWVIRTACEQARKWLPLGFAGKRIAVNLSGRCLKQPHMAEMIRGILTESGLPAEALEIELTESVSMEDVEGTVNLMQTLHAQGVHFAFDDFGTGYSSLSYLTRFPIQTLKIDRSFLLDIPGNRESAAIVRAIIALAHSLGHHVVAEGAETEAQVSFLHQEGCDAIQGYYYSRPVPAHEFSALLTAHVKARPSC